MEWKFGLSFSLLSLDMKACNKYVSSFCSLDLCASIRYFYMVSEHVKLLQFFQDFIKRFHYNISLWVIWTTLMVLNNNFPYYGSNSLTNKFNALISSQTLLTSKPSDNVFKYRYVCYINGAILDRFCFISPSQIIYSSNDILGFWVPRWRCNRSYKINGPFLKILQYSDIM